MSLWLLKTGGHWWLTVWGPFPLLLVLLVWIASSWSSCISIHCELLIERWFVFYVYEHYETLWNVKCIAKTKKTCWTGPSGLYLPIFEIFKLRGETKPLYDTIVQGCRRNGILKLGCLSQQGLPPLAAPPESVALWRSNDLPDGLKP